MKNAQDEQEDAEKELLVEKDDEFNLQKARAWDDWKDGESCLGSLSESNYLSGYLIICLVIGQNYRLGYRSK